MSIQALDWAIDLGEQKKLSSTERLILLILGNRADETGYLYPSMRWVCKQSGLSRRAAQINCRRLEALGLFRRETRTTVIGDRTSDGWQLAMPVDNSVEIDDMGGAPDAPPAKSDVLGAHDVRHPRAPRAPDTEDLDSLSKRRTQRTNIPENFVASAAVLTWARSKGVDPAYVASCLEAFILDAGANARRYANWDQALMNWIRREPSFSGRGGATAPAPRSSVKRCAYCTAAATGSVGGINHCREHTYDAMDRKAVPAPA